MRKIDFERLSKLQISNRLAETFQLITMSNINDVFSIQPLSSRNIKPTTEIMEEINADSSSDEEYYDDMQQEADKLPTITEE